MINSSLPLTIVKSTIKSIVRFLLRGPSAILLWLRLHLVNRIKSLWFIAGYNASFRTISYRTDLIGSWTQKTVLIGEYCKIDPYVTFWLGPNQISAGAISIGNNTYIGRNCYLASHLRLDIGNDCLIGAYSYITTTHHQYSDPSVPIRSQGIFGSNVKIGDGCWIGTHVCILPGVSVGHNSIIGAGSVVTKSVPPNEIWAGIPAKKIRSRI